VLVQWGGFYWRSVDRGIFLFPIALQAAGATGQVSVQVAFTASASVFFLGASLLINWRRSTPNANAKDQHKTKATHARALALAAFRTPTAQVFQSPWFTVKRWSAAL
jgi:hypothetical protein